MPVLDIATVIGGYGQFILDWPIGDDRHLFGDTQFSVNPPPTIALSDAYFTLKLNPNDVDANAIIQKHITQVTSPAGAISPGFNGNLTSLLIKISSNDYQSLVNTGTVYYWDIRCIASDGTTFTVATGEVAFLQGVTQTNAAGTPAALPNNGQPQFRGFTAYNPQVANLPGIYNVGDVFFNLNPSNGNGIGWQCLIGGAPGTWIAFVQSGIVQGPPGPPGPIGATGPQGPQGPPGGGGGSGDAHFMGYAIGPPVVGPFVVGDYFLNLVPAPGTPEGWVCTVAGTPGTWNTKGIVGDSSGA
jgi:hypothetical protein